MKCGIVKNFINGEFVNASSVDRLDVISPIDGALLSSVPMSGAAELDMAVDAAKKAFPSWSRTPIKERVQVFFRYKYLLEKHLHPGYYHGHHGRNANILQCIKVNCFIII